MTINTQKKKVVYSINTENKKVAGNGLIHCPLGYEPSTLPLRHPASELFYFTEVYIIWTNYKLLIILNR